MFPRGECSKARPVSQCSQTLGSLVTSQTKEEGADRHRTHQALTQVQQAPHGNASPLLRLLYKRKTFSMFV